MDGNAAMGHIGGKRQAIGFTLTEVLVAVVVGLLVLAGVHRIFISGLTTQTTTSLQMEVNRAAQVAIDDMAARLRGSSAVVDADPDRVAFTDQNGNNVRYWVSNRNLYRAINASNYTGGMKMAGDVSELQFLYYIQYPGTPAPSEAEAKQVVVLLEIERGGHSARLRSSVRLRNK